MSFDPVSLPVSRSLPTAEPAHRQLILASLIGTTIEFYDFYIYGTAAALVVGSVFFPKEAPATQALNAFLTFGVAFLARPVGSVVFGHFGDRIGRKSTLVASLLVMGLSTTLIGVLPGYGSLGALAPWLLCLLRFGQGVGLGGEWGGAALLTTENAPSGRRAWYGMYPQLGSSLGFLLANGLFLALILGMGEPAFLAWGWRIPFVLSAVLVMVGLYVRLTLTETPAFKAALAQRATFAVPLARVLREHWAPLVQGSLAMVVCYALFYITTVFALSYGTGTIGIPRSEFLGFLCVAVLFLAAATPLSGALADRFGRKPVLAGASVLAGLAGVLLPTLLGQGSVGAVLSYLCLSLFVMGLTFAPMGALLPELFPTTVRYTGAATAYNLGGILGASLAPTIAQWLLQHAGLAGVGGYLVGAAILSLTAILTIPETGGYPTI